MDPFKYCIECNPETNFVDLEFRSQNDEPIDGLEVTVSIPGTACKYTETTSNGRAFFGGVALGRLRVTVSTDSLLSEVEKYASRKDGTDSPVKLRAESEVDFGGKNNKWYREATIGDFWDVQPDDKFLLDNHSSIDINASETQPGFCVAPNHTVVFEVRALRSYIPYIVDTDEFSLVNSYTFALLSRLAYATDKVNLDDKKTTASNGSIGTIIEMLKKRELPIQTADIKAKWLVEEVPYKQALNFQYYDYDNVGAEGYFFYNDDIVVIGIRGTEPYFNNGQPKDDRSFWEIVNEVDGIGTALNTLPEVQKITSSSFKQDLLTDIDAAQIAVPEFGNTFVHQGFYNYTIALWGDAGDDSSLSYELAANHSNKKFYVCGHSLGGASALILSALVAEHVLPSNLRIYTYGSPRAGTQGFVERYSSIVHHRHVNDDDFIPQIPTKWMNTADKMKGRYLSILKEFGGSLGEVVAAGVNTMDLDDDNYRHHGLLTQLLIYTPHWLEEKQLLLTPKQTNIPQFGAMKNCDKDSYHLLSDIEQEHNILDMMNFHGMNMYIPNLGKLLQMLSITPLHEHYSVAIKGIQERERKLEIKQELTQERHYQAVSRSGQWGYSPTMGAETFQIGQQIEINRNMLSVYARIIAELKDIIKTADDRASEQVLVAHAALDEALKEQICELFQ